MNDMVGELLGFGVVVFMIVGSYLVARSIVEIQKSWKER